MRESNRGALVFRIAGVKVVLKEDQENAINGKQKDSSREEIVVVSDTTRMSVQNWHQNPLLPLNHRMKRMVEACREESLRGRSASGKFARQPCRVYIKGKCTRPSCDYWHPPESQLYETESGCKFGEKCSFAHRQVEDQPSKKNRRRMVTKMQWLFWKIQDSWVAYFRTLSRRNLLRFYRRARKP